MGTAEYLTWSAGCDCPTEVLFPGFGCTDLGCLASLSLDLCFPSTVWGLAFCAALEQGHWLWGFV